MRMGKGVVGVVAAAVLIAVFVLCGCGSRAQQLYARGDHEAMIRAFGSKGFREIGSMDLYYLCPSYLAMRKYKPSLQCASELESRDQSAVNAMGQIFTPSLLKAKAYLVKLQAYLDTGDFALAVAYGEKAYKLAEEGGFSVFTGMDAVGIDIIGDLGLAYAASGNAVKARVMAEKLDNYSMSALRGYVFEPYRQLQRIRIAFALKDYAQVLALCEGNESIFDNKWWSDLPGHRFTYSKTTMGFVRAKASFEAGRIAEADELYTALLKTPGIEANADIYAYALADLGSIRIAQGKADEGIALLIKAVGEIEVQRSTITTENARIGFFGDKQTAYRALIGALVAKQRYGEAFEYVERSKSRALVDMLATKMNFAVPAGNERRVRALLARRERAEQEMQGAEGEQQRSSTRGLLIGTNEELRAQAGEVAALVTVTALSAADIRKLIPADETLIEYYYTDRDLYAFVATAEGVTAVRTDTGRLVDDIREYRKALENPSAAPPDAAAAALYDKLVKPVAGDLKTSKLIVVPHGALHYLPFYALRGDGGCVIDRYAVRMLPSASVLAYLTGEKIEKPGGILAFGNPDLGMPGFDLAFAQNEAVAVARTMPDSKVLLRKDATESALKEYGGGFRYIHFATHGDFDAVRPLNSAILLARDDRSNGRLTVDKLYSMHLNADLVTLSACETGLGRVANGDDVVGLTRGFLYAGCRSIVASLWKVDDRATAALMTRFYEELEKGDKRQALRTAQLVTKKEYSHPYYWASFQLTGSAR
jgi:CHAT domain-containing protein